MTAFASPPLPADATATSPDGSAVRVPLGTRFQFRAAADQPLSAVAVTMPPWPGAGEAMPVQGPWEPTP